MLRLTRVRIPQRLALAARYAFAQRADTKVVDEPLYAHYLTTINPTALRPYRDEVPP
ncbi:hypothetical protein T484DRAFT_1824133 [Baffinella frigidus]|nr:hypothetical protein T484DRAFT_1824133 [Cryptophyta sp. CCMP2293]